MPRPKKPGQDGKEAKKRSRNGCWPCKARKVKCGEEKPACVNCQRQGETCDYSIRLNWDGRNKKKEDGRPGSQMMSFDSAPPLIRHESNGSTQSGYAATIYSTQYSPRPAEFSPPQPTQPYPAAGPGLLPALNDFSTAPNNGLDVENSPLPAPPPLYRDTSWENATRNIPSITSVPSARLPGSLPAYPSPSDSSFGSPSNGQSLFPPNYSMAMPPPSSNPMMPHESVRSPYNPAKRMRLSPRNDNFRKSPNLINRSSSHGPIDLDEAAKFSTNPLTPNAIPSHLSNPLTPATSAQESDDRRISVSSLLSDPDPADASDNKQNNNLEQFDLPAYTMPEISPYLPQAPPRRGSLHQTMITHSETETYGTDRGYPDLDLPRNNDTIAITGASPSEHSDFDAWLNENEPMLEFGFGLENKDTVFAKGGYYSSPVTIKIPRKLEPLPRILSENPMNLLYFHHFLNHTARILVPHDCPENPFKTILPQMAVENPNLLHLLLAYSACHRARLLGHPEPSSRIAHWVQDVFPSLRHSLENISNTAVSNANLATAIMLASMEIISPSSFGVNIPWQNHLSIARSIIRQRGGPSTISRADPVMYFLTRWLAYLDVLGSLSGRWNEDPLFAGNYWSNAHDDHISTKELSLTDEDEDDDYTIDCLLGFTTRCVSILAQVALLARRCDGQRIDAETGQINVDWRPSQDILIQADKLQKDLEHARDHEQKQCSHHSPGLSRAEVCAWRRPSTVNNLSEQEAEESLATNSAFHWAGLIHLLRRVHNLPRSDPQIQQAVGEVVKILDRIREGGSAEACLLFPMFTAGVEAESELHRLAILTRIKGAEGLGMCQVSRARKIMEEVWRTGVSWESLVTGEFFG